MKKLYKIIGLMMIKNEDRFVATALEKALPFVDHMIVLDTGSCDETIYKITPLLASARCSSEVHIGVDLIDTHDFVQPYIGKPIWLFGVDGDEIYDTVGLMRIRKRLLAGVYEAVHQIRGWYVHVESDNVSQESDRRTVQGYFGPPAPSHTKLYNCANILKWPNDHTAGVFDCDTRETAKAAVSFVESKTWSESQLRCIHMKRLIRSSLQNSQSFKRSPKETITNTEDDSARYVIGVRAYVDFDTFESIGYDYDL